MTVFRALAAIAQVVLAVLLAWVLMLLFPVALMLLVLMVPEEMMDRALSIFTLTFLALALITLVVAAARAGGGCAAAYPPSKGTMTATADDLLLGVPMTPMPLPPPSIAAAKSVH